MLRDQYLRTSTNSNAYISEQIRNEIQRFESVHPCIYTVYDLIELIPDQMLQNQLRDQVVCIEGEAILYSNAVTRSCDAKTFLERETFEYTLERESS
uniref:Uncharacterized protein n=1 Tax=Ascaris lumbricoides TaxID=6252 RepID=A0A9J2P0S7_ASCLU